MNIAHNLDRAAWHFPNHEAIVFEGRSWTYGELRAAVDRTAYGLAALGVDVGDRVGLFLPNIPAFPIAYLAVQKLGAIAVSINTMLTANELEYIVADSGAGTIFTTGELLPRLKPLLAAGIDRERIVVCEGAPGEHPTLEQLAADGDTPFEARERDQDDAAAILYTSGTTGRQKGAVLTHGNVISNMHATSHVLRLDPEDRSMLFLPLFHCFGQNFIMNTALVSAATIVLHRRFVAEEVLESISASGATRFFAVPAIYIGLLDAGVAPADLEPIRYYFSAAAMLPVEIGERWRERFGLPIHEGYGLTETSPHATHNHVWEHRAGTVGTPIENVEVKVVDADDCEVAAGTWGEVVIRGPNVMLGYWNRPDESGDALRGGWFHTGDIGFLDEAGYLSIVDRVKDMINVGGFKLWPREIEEVLYQHSAVTECAVIGVPDRVKGELPVAIVVARGGAELRQESLKEFCRERLATYKIPSSFDFVDELPKTPSGKILKRVLRERGRALSARSAMRTG
ncbi:MAG: long-chain fatty acid--CoA ligase [Actinomycetota bacterium]|nr:long-chain fatty acid--CoA ligase [Actinomycetota bacterium]